MSSSSSNRARVAAWIRAVRCAKRCQIFKFLAPARCMQMSSYNVTVMRLYLQVIFEADNRDAMEPSFMSPADVSWHEKGRPASGSAWDYLLAAAATGSADDQLGLDKHRPGVSLGFAADEIN